MGRCNVQQRTFSGEIRYSATAANADADRGDGPINSALHCHVAGNADNKDDNGDDDRIDHNNQIDGGRHGPQSSCPATAAALARHGFDVVVIAERSGAIRKCADVPRYTSLSLVEDGGTMAQVASSSLAAAPVATSTAISTINVTHVSNDAPNSDQGCHISM